MMLKVGDMEKTPDLMVGAGSNNALYVQIPQISTAFSALVCCSKPHHQYFQWSLFATATVVVALLTRTCQ